MARADYAPRGGGNRRPAPKKKSGGGSGIPRWLVLLVGLFLGVAACIFVYALRYVSRPTSDPLRGTAGSTQRPWRDGEAQDAGRDDDATRPRSAPGKALTRSFGKSDAAANPSAAAAAGKGKTADDERINVPPKEKSRFTFYELLPSQEVIVPAQPEAKATATPPGGAPPPANPPATATTSTPPAPTEAAAEAINATPGSYVIQVASYRSPAEADRQRAALALAGVDARIEKVTIDNRDTYYRVRVGPLPEARARQALSQIEANGIQAMLVKLK